MNPSISVVFEFFQGRQPTIYITKHRQIRLLLTATIITSQPYIYANPNQETNLIRSEWQNVRNCSDLFFPILSPRLFSEWKAEIKDFFPNWYDTTILPPTTEWTSLWYLPIYYSGIQIQLSYLPRNSLHYHKYISTSTSVLYFHAYALEWPSPTNKAYNWTY